MLKVEDVNIPTPFRGVFKSTSTIGQEGSEHRDHIKTICRHGLIKESTETNISKVQILSVRALRCPLLNIHVKANMVLNDSSYPQTFESSSLSN